MIPVWDDKYSIGNEKIDEQHKKLFELAGEAYILAHRSISLAELKAIINDFFEYMKTHFNDEEQYMKRIGYPILEEHTKIHKEIVRKMIDIITKVKSVNEVKEHLVVIAKWWLLEHILQDDMLIEKWRNNDMLIKQHPEMNIEPLDFEAIKHNQTKNHSPNEPKPKPKSNILEYLCGCKGKIHKITPEIYQKITKGSKFTCRNCGKQIYPKP